MQQALIAFASSRLALIVTGYLCLTFFPAHPVESWQGLSFPGNNWIDGWVRWDSFWYESIVNPHPRFMPEYLSNANFFPFYSWVSWLVSLPLRAFLDLGARVLHRRADRVLGVVCDRPHRRRSNRRRAGRRGCVDADDVADRAIPVLVFLHRCLRRRAVLLPLRLVAAVRLRKAVACRVRAGGAGVDDPHSRASRCFPRSASNTCDRTVGAWAPRREGDCLHRDPRCRPDRDWSATTNGDTVIRSSSCMRGR